MVPFLVQCALAERISDYLAQCSIRFCFQRPSNPLNGDVDELFAEWVHPGKRQGCDRYGI